MTCVNRVCEQALRDHVDRALSCDPPHSVLSFPAFNVPSGALTQAIRNFAKSLEGWLTTAMNAVPQRMVQTKVSVYQPDSLLQVLLAGWVETGIEF